MIQGPESPEGARHGERRRRQILAAARDVSSAEGLEGVSIQRLAREVGMSKSGLAAHFVSKQKLQLAAVRAAAEDYETVVVAPPREVEAGLPRLRAMMDAWVRYLDEIGYRGGCFFAAAGNEFGSRPGPVRDLLARYTRSWMRALEQEAHTAIRLGELRPHVDPKQLAFMLHAFVQEANLCRRLLDESDAFDRARGAAVLLIDQLRVPESKETPHAGSS